MRIVPHYSSLMIIAGALILASAWAQSPSNLPSRVSDTGDATYETVFVLPADHPDSPRYQHGGPELLRWGPSALAVDTDGTFWIADAVANRLLQYNPQGRLLRRIPLDEVVVGLRDIEVNQSGIWVLDIAAIVPAVLHFSREGKLLARYELPEGLHLEDGLTGVALSDLGELLVERYGGASVTRLLDEKGRLNPTPLDGYPYCNTSYSTYVHPINGPNPSTGYILANHPDKPLITVQVDQLLGGLFLLKVLSDGTVYALVEELARAPFVHVDQRVHKYDAWGNLIGMARIPLAEQYTYVHQVAAVGPDNEVYVLLTRPNHLEVARLVFQPSLKPILQAHPLPPEPPSSDFFPASCVSRTTMRSAVDSYINNSSALNNTNINGSCAYRQKPRYLGSAGTYSSVPYDWGGFDLPSHFNSAMAQNRQAGDISADTSGDVACSRGVDCSGFVSRVWQLGTKHSTSTIPNISSSISQSQLTYGDVMNLPGSHVILYEEPASNGFRGAESTTYGSADRVVRWHVPWSRVNGYSSRRFNQACPLPAAPTLFSPGNNTVVTTTSPTLRWNAASHANSYQVEVARDLNFTNRVFSTTTTGTSVTVSGLARNTTYYWRVRGVNGEGAGPWSSVWQFTTPR
ncbi:MAG: fibronectin type III domain-containing protein [Fimbriimonadales bacterium]|nr:fibronectin type III domain-containing protein [Fimbriimonadales bacterium]